MLPSSYFRVADFALDNLTTWCNLDHIQHWAKFTWKQRSFCSAILLWEVIHYPKLHMVNFVPHRNVPFIVESKMTSYSHETLQLGKNIGLFFNKWNITHFSLGNYCPLATLSYYSAINFHPATMLCMLNCQLLHCNNFGWYHIADYRTTNLSQFLTGLRQGPPLDLVASPAAR